MSITSHTILLVEDDPDDRYIMHLAFSELSFEEHVKVFEGGDSFLRYLRSLPHHSLYPLLIVIDYNMPGMNGGELLMRLKMDENLRHIPVAMYSTGMKSVEPKLRTLGANYCFEKGAGYKDIYKLVQQLRSIVEGEEVPEKK